MGNVTVRLEAARFQSRDNGQFSAMVERATDQAAYSAARQGAAQARAILGGKWKGACTIDAEGGGGHWEIVASGPWAEAAEFGIPGHPIDTDKYSLYKEGVFPTIINPRTGKPIRVQHVDHPGVLENRMIETAGDIVANEFEGILVSYLP